MAVAAEDAAVGADVAAAAGEDAEVVADKRQFRPFEPDCMPKANGRRLKVNDELYE